MKVIYLSLADDDIGITGDTRRWIYMNRCRYWGYGVFDDSS